MKNLAYQYLLKQESSKYLNNYNDYENLSINTITSNDNINVRSTLQEIN